MIRKIFTASVPWTLMLFPIKLFSQSPPERIAQQFSPSVLCRVYENVESKMKLSEASKAWLATAYSKQDSLIATLIIRNGLVPDYIKRFSDSTRWAIENEFIKIISPSEKKEFESNISMIRPYPTPVFNNRIAPDAEINSIFGTALKMKDRLSITDKQGDSLLDFATLLKAKMDFNKANPDSGFFDKAAFESKYMSMVISEKQYNIMLAEKNIKTSEVLARYAWHEIKVLGLANKFNKDTAIKYITIYYLLKTHITERFAHEKERRSLMLKSLKMPEALKALQAARNGNAGKLEQYAW